MKKIIIIIAILSLCISNLKAQDSICFSNNNVDTIYSVIYDKVFELVKKCYPDYKERFASSAIKEGFAGSGVIQDLIDTTNHNWHPKKKPPLRFFNNHIYNVYIVNEECVSVLMLLHNNKAYFFNEYEYIPDTIGRGFIDLLDTLVPYYTIVYAYNHQKKLNSLLETINRIGIKYTDEELFRIKDFNGRWRTRNYK